MAKKTLAEKMAENSKSVVEALKINTIGSFSSTENIKKSIIVLDELKYLIPPLLETEFLALKENLQKNGCKDPLKVWQTNNQTIDITENPDDVVYVLIDGHNRFQLCNELQIPFNIQIDNFESLKDVRDFMIDFQLSRRNITPQQASYLRGLKYNTEKREVLDNLTNLPSDTNLPNGHYDHLANFEKKTTAQELGKYFNVGEKTIRRDAEFARGLEKLEIGFRQDILKGLIKVEKIKLQKISQAANIIEPIKSIEELNFVYNTLIVEEPISNASPILNLKEQKYSDLNFQLQRIYTSTTHTNADIKALKTIFKEFMATL